MENSKKSSYRFLKLLKVKGAQPAAALAKEFEMTVEGARLQLAKLAEEGLVEALVSAKGVGRPNILYSLTKEANKEFPDAHPELALQVLSTIQTVLGQNALEAVVNARGVTVDRKYSAGIEGAKTFEEKLDKLVSIRTEEGYLAAWEKNGNDFLFIENHCPICSAATHCNSLCQSELNTFINILGPHVQVERTEHILSNDRRCVYRITPGFTALDS